MKWTKVSKDLADWLVTKGCEVRFIARSGNWYALV
jgi:hypothetical protein